MKKGALLNSKLSRVIASLGHTDMLTVADAGLPVAPGVEKIDLALIKGLPSLLDVIKAVTLEMHIERVIMATEIRLMNEPVHQQILEHIAALQIQQGNQIMVDYIDHEQFKAVSERSRAVIRTGECTSYANVHFIAGVTF
jgi:D-ribose pyranase